MDPMDRNFLFLSGEFRVTMPAVFKTDNWVHTQSASRLVIDNKILRRKNQFSERLKGVIYYADAENKSIEVDNLTLLNNNSISCWPSPAALLNMTDRHEVMKQCIDNNIVSHNVIQITYDQIDEIQNYPAVVKTGFSHRGLGKFLVNSKNEIEPWEGIATVEPFFKGDSIRILILGEKEFGIKITNSNSWIANSPGAETSRFTPSQELINHARKTADLFELDAAGVDYILNGNDFHFLEINQFPGLDVDDEIAEYAKDFLGKKMAYVESLAEHNV